MTQKKAIVLMSGGLDSTTMLAMAIADGYACYGLSFDYGQRHKSELNAAKALAKSMQLKEYRVAKLDLSVFGHSALTDITIAVPESDSDEPAPGIPITYVPARNTVFLSYALAWAEVIEAHSIFIGVNAVDYSGYPDCRPEFINAFQVMANLATKIALEGQSLSLNAPLINLSKADIVRRGVALGVDYAATVSCYQANEKGEACGRCDSCRLRRAGFEVAGIKDPTRYRS